MVVKERQNYAPARTYKRGDPTQKSEPFERHRTELVHDRTRWRMDQITAYRNLYHRPITLGNVDESRRIGTREFVKGNAMNRRDLVRVCLGFMVIMHPENKRRHDVTRPRRIVVELPQQMLLTKLQSDLLVHLSKGSFKRCLAGIDAAARERPLAGMCRQMSPTTGQQQRSATGRSIDSAGQRLGIAGDAIEISHAFDLGLVGAMKFGITIEQHESDRRVPTAIEIVRAHPMPGQIVGDSLAEGIVEFHPSTMAAGEDGYQMATRTSASVWAAPAAPATLRRWLRTRPTKRSSTRSTTTS